MCYSACASRKEGWLSFKALQSLLPKSVKSFAVLRLLKPEITQEAAALKMKDKNETKKNEKE